jgi:hypothetical protein
MKTLLFLLTVQLSSAQVYVSTTGDDGNDGTEGKPVLTLQRARDLVRQKNGSMTSDLTVHLAPGLYRLKEPLLLDARDSGAGGHSVIYSGSGAVVSGGLKVTGWKKAGKYWTAPAPAGLTNTRQLYVDGVRAHRTRGRLPIQVTPTPTGYIANTATMAAWRNPSDIEFVYTGGNSVWSEPSEGLGPWTEPRCPVASIRLRTITMARPCWDNSTKRVMLASGQRAANLVGPQSVGNRPAYIENAFELLGTPGEWYFDRKAKLIYYTPRPGEDLASADVEAATLESLIVGQGTAEASIHHIQFVGIQFSYATWLMPSSPEGFSEIQANYIVTGEDGYKRQGLCSLVPVRYGHPFHQRRLHPFRRRRSRFEQRFAERCGRRLRIHRHFRRWLRAGQRRYTNGHRRWDHSGQPNLKQPFLQRRSGISRRHTDCRGLRAAHQGSAQSDRPYSLRGHFDGMGRMAR